MRILWAMCACGWGEVGIFAVYLIPLRLFVFHSRLAFERALDLNPRCVGALVGLALLELNSKQVQRASSLPHPLPLFLFPSLHLSPSFPPSSMTPSRRELSCSQRRTPLTQSTPWYSTTLPTTSSSRRCVGSTRLSRCCTVPTGSWKLQPSIYTITS